MTSPASAPAPLGPNDPLLCRGCWQFRPRRSFILLREMRTAPTCHDCRILYRAGIQTIDLSACSFVACAGCGGFLPWPRFLVPGTPGPGDPAPELALGDRCPACRRRSAPRRRCAKAPKEALEDRILRALKEAGKPTDRESLRASVGCKTKALKPVLLRLVAACRVVQTGTGKKGSPGLWHLPPTSPEAPGNP